MFNVIVALSFHFEFAKYYSPYIIFRRLLRRHGSSQSGCSNISLLDEIAQSYHTGVINQDTVSSLPLPVPEMDTESNLEDERYQIFLNAFKFLIVKVQFCYMFIVFVTRCIS